MKLAHLEVGDFFVHVERKDRPTRWRVVAHDVTTENRVVPQELLDDLGVRSGIGNGATDRKVSLPARFGSHGMLAVRADWNREEDRYLALFPTGHDLFHESTFMRMWTKQARRSFRFLNKYGIGENPSGKAEVRYIAISNPEPTSPGFGHRSQTAPYGKAQLMWEEHLYPVSTDEPGQSWVAMGENVNGIVYVRDAEGTVFGVDPHFLIFDPYGNELESIMEDRIRAATKRDRERLRMTLQHLANEHDTADSRAVSVSNNSVTMPIEVLESILLGTEEWATAELLDGIMILKDVLEEAS